MEAPLLNRREMNIDGRGVRKSEYVKRWREKLSLHKEINGGGNGTGKKHA